jgi:DNA-binding NtrC family response regulator
MPDTDGVTLLKEWASMGLLNMPVIMMSGHATVDTAVEATRIGAHAFLEKPITMQKLLKAVEQGLNKRASAAPANKSVPAGAQATAAAIGSVVVAQTVVLPPTHQSFDLELPLRDARDAFEQAYFEYHLAKENGSMTRVAEKTGLERTHLYRKLKQLGVDLSKAKRTA